MTTNFCKGFYFAPVRAVPRSIYSDSILKYSSTGEHTPHLMKKMLQAGRNKLSKFQLGLLKSIEQFGKNSGLFDRVVIQMLRKQDDSLFEVCVEFFGKRYNINNVGYGVSQILPIFFEILVSASKSCFAIQQPEVHLHPKAQAAFGEFLFEAAYFRSHTFMVETHSDFLIDRFRLQYLRKDKNRPIPKAQVLFFEKNKNGNTIFPIPIEESGKYSENQPEGFREFFIKEELALLDL